MIINTFYICINNTYAFMTIEQLEYWALLLL